MNRMAINDRYEYINEEFISERLKCTICSNPSIEPVKTKCKPREHTFCRYCIEQWLQHDSTCPSCRQTLKIQYLTPITEGILLGMLNELSVQCLFCKKTGLERGDFDEHLKKVCVERNILCSSADIKCPWNGSPQLLEEHLQTCSYTALRTMLTQMMTDNKQLNEQVNQQKTLIDKLQTENRQFKEQQSIPIIKSLIESRPPEMPKRSRENPSISANLNRRPLATPKASCDNCSDCWHGAVRGGYFRGQSGGGLKLGSTMLSCDCDCHK